MRNMLLGFVGLVMLSACTGCEIGDRLFYTHQPWGGTSGDGCNCGCSDGCGCARAQCDCNSDGGGCAGGQCGNGGCAGGGCGNGACMPGHDGLFAGRPLPRGEGGCYTGPQGPPTGGVAYPYYTVRGPRDFLDPNPPSIGY